MGSPKARLLLAVLAHSAGRVVPTATLIDRAWGPTAPDAAHVSIQAYFSRTRKYMERAGGEARIVSRASGYVLDVPPESVDVHRARALELRARARLRAGDHATAAVLLDEALSLWLDDPLAEVPGGWAESVAVEFTEHRSRLLARWAEVALALGDADAVAERLGGHAPNEQLTYPHMLALEAAGRHSEAIDCYTRLRERVRAESGTDPNPRTQSLFQRILIGAEDPVPFHAVGRALPEPRLPEVVDTLAPDVPDFVGREEELEVLREAAEQAEDSPVVQMVTGIGGTGKTTLVVHAAHWVRERFDIRLQVEVRDSGGAEVLGRLLPMVGVPREKIPPDLEGRVALWRSQITGRRVLLLLDNARNGQVVAPLVPTTPGSLVLVTSRWSLADLDGARARTLEPLDEEDAAAMFSAFSGRAPDTEGMDRVVRLNGGMPLALRVTSRNLRRRTTWTLVQLADRLAARGSSARKSAEQAVFRSFEDSFDSLSPNARRTFLCLGLHPTATVVDYTLAAVVGDQEEMEEALEELLDAHFVQEVGLRRFRSHDMVRQFAQQQAERTLSNGERRDIERRFLDHYLAAVDRADRVARPGRRRSEHIAPFSPSVPAFSGPREARDWFIDTFPAVDAAIVRARENGLLEYVGRMPLAMAGLLDGTGPLDRAEQLLEWSVEAWRELGSPAGHADSLYELAVVLLRRGDRNRAEAMFRSVLSVWENHGSERNALHARDWLAVIRSDQGGHREALTEFKVVLAGFTQLRDRWGMARVRNHMATSEQARGKNDLAMVSHTTAMHLYRVLGDAQLEMIVASNLAGVKFTEGYHRDARRMYERVLRVHGENGDVAGVALAHMNLGTVADYRRRPQEALTHFRSARRGFWATGEVGREVKCTAGIGEALVALGRLGEAQTLLEEGQERVWSSELESPHTWLLRALGDLYAARRRRTEAKWYYICAMRSAEKDGNVVDTGRACDRLGDLYRSEGEWALAFVHWRQAVQILDRVPNPYVGVVRMKIEAGEDVNADMPS